MGWVYEYDGTCWRSPLSLVPTPFSKREPIGCELSRAPEGILAFPAFSPPLILLRAPALWLLDPETCSLLYYLETRNGAGAIPPCFNN